MKIVLKFFIFSIFFTGILYSQTREWLLYQLTYDNFNVSAICEDNEGNMWFSVYKDNPDYYAALYKLEGDSIIMYDSSSPGFTNPARIWGLAVDQQNNLWMASSDTGVIKFDGTNWSYFNMLVIAPNSISNSAWDVEVDEENNIWVGTYWAGLAKYDGQDWTIYDNTNSPMPPGQMEINVIHIDINSNLWYGSDRDGIGRFDRKNNWKIFYWQFYFVYSIDVEKTGVVWLLSGGTYIRRLENDSTWSDYNNFDFSIPFGSTYQIAIDSNDVKWFTKDKNIHLYNQNGVITFDDKDVNELYPPFDEVLDPTVYVYSVYIDKYNNKWLGYSNGYVVKYMGDDITDVKKDEQDIPVHYNLLLNYPNPFNPSTIISYQIPERGLVKLKVYDVLGNEIVSIVNEEKAAGQYQVEFNSENLSSGIYIYRMQVNNYIESKKMILLR